jgi:hypothetical protein
LNKECMQAVQDKYLPAIRGLGKSATTTTMMHYETLKCCESDEEYNLYKEIFLALEGKCG